MPEEKKWNMPGPIWAWLIAAIACSQLVKRGIIGWPLPKEFHFGNRFMENFVANMLYGLPVLVVFLIALYVVNRQRGDSS